MVAAIISITVLAIIIVGSVITYKSIKKDKTNVNNVKTINANVLQKLRTQHFDASHICYMADYSSAGTTDNSAKQMLCVDVKAKKLALVNYADGSYIIVNFADVISYDIYNNGKTDTSGGVIYGLVITESTEKCQELKLILRLKSFDKPQFEYMLISHTLFNDGIDKGQRQYGIIMNDLQQTISYLELVLNENKNNNS